MRILPRQNLKSCPWVRRSADQCRCTDLPHCNLLFLEGHGHSKAQSQEEKDLKKTEKSRRRKNLAEQKLEQDKVRGEGVYGVCFQSHLMISCCKGSDTAASA
jgi:hypothetical protein